MRWGLLLVVVLAACTERNPEVCCETDAECARVDLTSAVPCASGVCVRNLCAASGCDGPEDCGGAACSEQGACEPGLDAPATDAPAAAVCAWDAPFTAPVPIGGLDAANLFESGADLTRDELTVYLAGSVTFQGENQLYTATRNSREQSFPMPVLVPNVNTGEPEYDPTFDAEETTLIFTAIRGSAPERLYASTRASRLVEFPAGQPLANIPSGQTAARDSTAFLTRDGGELWFASTRTPGSGASDIWRATRSGGTFATPTRIAELNTSSDDASPVLSRDLLTVYFSSNRPGSVGFTDIYRAHRTTATGMFGAAERLANLSSARFEDPNFLSDDNCRLYLMIDNGTTLDIAVATRTP